MEKKTAGAPIVRLCNEKYLTENARNDNFTSILTTY